MKRRRMLQGLAGALLGWPLAARSGWAGQQGQRKILFFSRSALFEHSVVAARAAASLAEPPRRDSPQIDCTVE